MTTGVPDALPKKFSSPLREAQKELTRSKIRDAARALFNEQGFDRTTTEQIANRAELRRSTVYLHYKDKADILIDIVADYAPLARSWMENLPSEKPTPGAIEDWIEEIYLLSAGEKIVFSIISELASQGKGVDAIGLVTEQILLGLSSRSEAFRKAASDETPLSQRAQAVFLVQQLTYYCQLRIGETNEDWAVAVKTATAANFLEFMRAGR